MKKRITSLILISLLALTICACSSNYNNPEIFYDDSYSEVEETEVKEEKWTLEEATSYFENKLKETTNQTVIKFYVDNFENDDDFYAFALTGSEDMLPYDEYEIRNLAKDTHIWFISKNTIEEMDYHIISGDIPYDMNLYTANDGTKFVYVKIWDSDWQDNNIFYLVKDGLYIEKSNIMASLYTNDNGELCNLESYYDCVNDEWIENRYIIDYDGEEFSLVMQP